MSPSTRRGVNDFLDSLGACSAISRRGESLAKTIGASPWQSLARVDKVR
jgi:hypothetical protein